MKLEIDSLGRDLFAKIFCTCKKPAKAGEYAFSHQIRLTGYNDDYFFNVVNANPREGKCSNCGRAFKYQWKTDGVDFEWED